MLIEISLRKGDYYVILKENFITESYAEAVKLAMDKYTALGYSVSKVRNLVAELKNCT